MDEAAFGQAARTATLMVRWLRGATHGWSVLCRPSDEAAKFLSRHAVSSPLAYLNLLVDGASGEGVCIGAPVGATMGAFMEQKAIGLPI